MYNINMHLPIQHYFTTQHHTHTKYHNHHSPWTASTHGIGRGHILLNGPCVHNVNT